MANGYIRGKERKRERERERSCINEEEEGGIHVLTVCVTITDGFSIDNELMK